MTDRHILKKRLGGPEGSVSGDEDKSECSSYTPEAEGGAKRARRRGASLTRKQLTIFNRHRAEGLSTELVRLVALADSTIKDDEAKLDRHILDRYYQSLKKRFQRLEKKRAQSKALWAEEEESKQQDPKRSDLALPPDRAQSPLAVSNLDSIVLPRGHELYGLVMLNLAQ